jgi:entry exclusion lipoprotein TrbK
MKNITRVFIVSALASFVLVGCDEDDGPKPATINCDNPNLTKEQRKEGNCLWDMGKPTDRSKNKGF